MSKDQLDKNEKVRYGDWPTVPLRIQIATSFIAGAGGIMTKWQSGMDKNDMQKMAKEALQMADILVEEHNKEQK